MAVMGIMHLHRRLKNGTPIYLKSMNTKEIRYLQQMWILYHLQKNDIRL